MITIDLGSGIVATIILVWLTYLGWKRGFRFMLSIALFTTIAYLLTVSAGTFLVGFVNRVYTNLPRLGAFALGRDPGTIGQFDPLIPDNFQSPLLLRVLVFVALLAVGIGYSWPWEAKVKPGDRKMELLGALTGLYIGVLSISAVATFWGQTDGTLGLPNPVIAALNAFPDFSGIIPSTITAFFILLIVIILLRFNQVWRP